MENDRKNLLTGNTEEEKSQNSKNTAVLNGKICSKGGLKKLERNVEVQDDISIVNSEMEVNVPGEEKLQAGKHFQDDFRGGIDEMESEMELRKGVERSERNECEILKEKDNSSEDKNIPKEDNPSKDNDNIPKENNPSHDKNIPKESPDKPHLECDVSYEEHSRSVRAMRRSEVSLSISENYKKYSEANIVLQEMVKVPPDGGYGWVVACAVSIIYILVPSLSNCYGLVYADVKARGDYSHAQMVGVATIGFALRYLLSPASSRLSEAWGSRWVTVTGLGSVSLALLGSAFTHTNVGAFYICYGVLYGIGASMAYPQLTLIVQQYFTSKRVTAVALSGIGIPVGNIVMPPLVFHLIRAYSVQGAFLIWSAVTLHGLVAALLFHPVSWHKKKIPSFVYDKQQPSPSPKEEVTFHVRGRRASFQAAALIDDEMLARSCSINSMSYKSEDVRKQKGSSQRLNSIPKRCENAQEKLSEREKLQPIIDSSSFVANALEGKEDKDSELNSLTSEREKYSDEEYFSAQSALSVEDEPEESSGFDSTLENVKSNFFSKVQSILEEEAPLSPIKFQISCPESDGENEELNANDKQTHFLTVNAGQSNALDRKRLPPKKEASNANRASGWTSGFIELMLSYKEILSHKLFFLSCLSTSFARLVFVNYVAFLPLRGTELVAEDGVLWLLLTVAVCDVAVKLIAAAFTAMYKVKTRYLYLCGTLLTAGSCLAASVAKGAALLYVSCCLMGAGMAVQMSTGSVLLLEAIGSDLMTRGIGLNFFMVGVIALVVMPLNGALLDLTGTYRSLYLALTGCSLVPALTWSLGYHLVKRC